MESLLSLPRMHWDHEPTPNPSREGNGQDADRCLLPSWEELGVGRFMESLHSLLRMHWDHEPNPSPSQEGNGQDADRCLFPSWEGLGVGRFMERAVNRLIRSGGLLRFWLLLCALFTLWLSALSGARAQEARLLNANVQTRAVVSSLDNE